MNEFTMFTINLLFIYALLCERCFDLFFEQNISTENQTLSDFNVLNWDKNFCCWEISLSAVGKISNIVVVVVVSANVF